MFYAHFVLSKKGPLAKIWLAAHWDKKLTKAHVFETNIEGSVEAIIQPKAKLALRTSGHLLLGVVRIYSRKAKYLLADCNEAFVKIKMAFRPGIVDLPEENREAALSAITLPEAFHEFDTAMADLSDLEVQTQFAVNQSRPEEITMREDLGSITLIGDDGFGDMGFETGLLDDSQLEETLFASEPTDFATLAMMAMKENKETPDKESGEEDATAASKIEEDNYEGPAGVDDDYDSNDGGHYSPAGETELFTDPIGGGGEQEVGGLFEDPVAEDTSNNQPNHAEPPQTAAPFMSPSHKQQSVQSEHASLFSSLDPTMPQLDRESPLVSQPSPIQPPTSESETFTLRPIDVVVAGPERRYRKKRKLIVDEQKAIASETMKLQLSDTSDIITTLDLAPPTKKLMHWKETGGVDKLTVFPGRPIVSKKLFKLFSSSMTMKQPTDKLNDSTTSDKKEQNQQPENKRADEIEVRNTVGADGMPRLVFAVKKHFIPPASSVESLDTHHLPDDSSTFKVPHSPAPNDSILRKDFNNSSANEISQSINQGALPCDMPADNTSNIRLDQSSLQHASANEDVKAQNEEPIQNNDDNDDNDACGAYNDDDEEEDGCHDPRNDMEVDSVDQNGDELREDAESDNDEDQAAMEDDATTEEVEENRWNKKSQQMLHTLNKLLSKKDQISFKEMLTKCNRKQVASKFYSLLVLKKTQMVNVYQPQPYSDIVVTKGPLYAPLAG